MTNEACIVKSFDIRYRVLQVTDRASRSHFLLSAVIFHPVRAAAVHVQYFCIVWFQTSDMFPESFTYRVLTTMVPKLVQF